MYVILSPSKSQDFSRDFDLSLDFKKTEFLDETRKLHTIMKEKSKSDLEKLMKISPKLAELNFNRFQKWNDDFEERKVECAEGALPGDKQEFNFSPAIFAFTGDVYGGFDLENWKKSDFNFAQKHLGILSGFYGIIFPLDLIKPYRLEMGTKISFEIKQNKYKVNSEQSVGGEGALGYKNLYEFWGEKITEKISEILGKEKVLINLASVEYSKSINRKKLSEKVKIIDVEFKIKKGERISIIAIYAKKARGEMANWIIKNRIIKESGLERFNISGWKFSKKDSIENKLVFLKKI